MVGYFVEHCSADFLACAFGVQAERQVCVHEYGYPIRQDAGIIHTPVGKRDSVIEPQESFAVGILFFDHYHDVVQSRCDVIR